MEKVYLVDIGTEIGALEKSGAWYSYNGEKIGQGKENTKIFLKNNPEIAQDIDLKIREHFGISED